MIFLKNYVSYFSLQFLFNFGDGIVLDELRRLEAAPSLSLLHPQIKRALDAVERAGKSIDELANTVLRLKAIAQPNVRREIEG